jgi:hypothetical protein
VILGQTLDEFNSYPQVRRHEGRTGAIALSGNPGASSASSGHTKGAIEILANGEAELIEDVSIINVERETYRDSHGKRFTTCTALYVQHHQLRVTRRRIVNEYRPLNEKIVQRNPVAPA